MADHLFEDVRGNDCEITIRNGTKTTVLTGVHPKTPGQDRYMQAINNNNLVFCLGPAGTGKTFISSGMAAKALKVNRIERIICIRPAVGAGDPIGFLPGTSEEKLMPYLRPIMVELSKFFTPGEMSAYRSAKNAHDGAIIEIQPVDFMRGLTFHNSFIIVDEAQNCSHEQLKMIITRMGENTKMIINGDESQSDLPYHRRGALEFFAGAWVQPFGFNRVNGVERVIMSAEDVVRSQFLNELMKKWPEIETQNDKRDHDTSPIPYRI